jgi:XRE family transcriptional regulator, regulator of sulfur utilization
MKTLAALIGFATLLVMPPAEGSDAGKAVPAKPAKPGGPMGSMVIPWDEIQARIKPTKTGLRRDVFDAPTPTLDRFHCHITTLNPGENTGPLHRHPQEEVVIVKEGTLEINIDGRKQIAGPGSMIFYAANENENMTNVGKTPATYFVLQWFTALTPKD